jgi:biopolymer transport protein ExbD
MRLPTREVRKARIEIIPMIDAIFFLLVFFMITSLNEARMRAMTVALPKNGTAASAGGASGAGGNVILTMTDRGEYSLGAQRLGVDPAAVQTALTTRLRTATPRAVVLNFGKAQTTQALIGMMDVLNRAKAASGRDVPVLIATEPVDQNGRAIAPAVPAR